MPRLSASRLPAYCKHKQSGQSVVYLNGRDVLLGPHGTAASKREYDRVIAEWIANGRTLRLDQESLTVAQLFNDFRKWAEDYYRGPDGTPTGEWENFRIILHQLKLLYGDMPAAEFGPLKLSCLPPYRLIENHASSEGNDSGVRTP
jgi:hypothetical protein